MAYGNLAAAYCVVSREADVCLATRVMRKRTASLPAAKAFPDVLF